MVRIITKEVQSSFIKRDRQSAETNSSSHYNLTQREYRTISHVIKIQTPSLSQANNFEGKSNNGGMNEESEISSPLKRGGGSYRPSSIEGINRSGGGGGGISSNSKPKNPQMNIGGGVLPQLQNSKTLAAVTPSATAGLIGSPKVDNLSIFKKTKSSAQPFARTLTQKGLPNFGGFNDAT